MEILEIEIWQIEPPHKPRDCSRVKKLEQNLKGGWIGRPLLVEQLKLIGELSQRYAAWTGSHRIAAAKNLGFKSVPCLMITLEEANIAIDRGGYNRKVGYSSLRNAISGHDGLGDTHKLTALVEVGLSDAAEIMRTEIVENDRDCEI
ncbi:ParB N-terminal domain-containing protein [Desulfoluna sp.]|uniref:ParB N-terminal domain-containing protein n=1 Tax=Desulfoluna sp. TaxID=2045199 RepID=UPI002625B90E|nr:ParB N-terminal domain-containing protein [Desulfoluna sp.]